MASPAASKAKGRRLQQLVRDAILEAFPTLEPDDVKSTAMGQGGEDVQLSPAARKQFPYSIECKSRKDFKTLYGFLAQAESNAKGHRPIAVIKGDRQKPLVLVDFDHFMNLVQFKARNGT